MKNTNNTDYSKEVPYCTNTLHPEMVRNENCDEPCKEY
jgi:hypothetical protein